MKIFWILQVIPFFILLLSRTNSIITNTSNYEEEKAKEFWYYQSMSECNIDRITNWNVPPVSSLYPQVTDIQIFTNYTSTGANLGYIAYNHQTNIVFMSFRGSHNSTNNWEDMDFIKTDYDKCENCAVHQGFYHAYLDLKETILDAFINLSKKYLNAKTAVFGHSLGAAMATFAFIDANEKINVDYFYSFGSPRVGNYAFAEFYNKNFENSGKARITHFKDNVPHLPFEFLGFTHLNHEVFYTNEESSQYIICANDAEDPNCSHQFSYLSTEGNDHSNYMNFNMNDFTGGCH